MAIIFIITSMDNVHNSELLQTLQSKAGGGEYIEVYLEYATRDFVLNDSNKSVKQLLSHYSEKYGLKYVTLLSNELVNEEKSIYGCTVKCIYR